MLFLLLLFHYERKIEKYLKSKLDVLNSDTIGAEAEKTLDHYKRFYSKVALRNKELSRVNVFTTNNDMFNELALDSLSIHYFNGFSGGVKKTFNPASFNYTLSKRMDTSIDKYEPVENLVYLYKIHGSVNWIEDDNSAVAAENRNRAMAMVLEKNYLEVKKLLVEHRDLLDRLAAELMEKTTLVYSDVQRIISEITPCTEE